MLLSTHLYLPCEAAAVSEGVCVLVKRKKKEGGAKMCICAPVYVNMSTDAVCLNIKNTDFLFHCLLPDGQSLWRLS